MTAKLTETTMTVDVLCYLLSGFVILYILLRHALLVKGKLKPESLACGDCTKGACVFLKEVFGKWLGEADSVRVRNSSVGRLRSSSASKGGGDSGIAPIVSYCTFGCLVFWLLFTTERILSFVSKETLGWLPVPFYCQFTTTVGANLYMAGKSCMYLLFVARLKQAFEGSIYGASDRLLRALYASLCGYMFLHALSIWVFIRGEYVPVPHSNMRFCVPVIPKEHILLITAFEFIFVAVVVYKFVSSLNSFQRDFLRNKDEKSRLEFKQANASLFLLPLKYAVLSIVAVATMIIAFLLLAATGIQTVTPLDTAVNCASIVLMTGHWVPVYDWLCTPLLKCIVYTPCLPCSDLSASVQSKSERSVQSLASAKAASTDACVELAAASQCPESLASAESV